MILWEIVWVLCILLSVHVLLDLMIGKINLSIVIPVISLAVTPELYIDKVLKKQGESRNVCNNSSFSAIIYTKKFLKYNIVDNAVFPICSKNNQINDEPVCVGISNIKHTKSGLQCSISELPYGRKLDLDIENDFYICITDSIHIPGKILKKMV
jgi:hypothetical protein